MDGYRSERKRRSGRLKNGSLNHEPMETDSRTGDRRAAGRHPHQMGSGVLIALLLAAFLLTQSIFSTTAPEEVEVAATGGQEPAGPGAQAQVTARIREEGLRQEAQRQAAERDLQRRRELGIIRRARHRFAFAERRHRRRSDHAVERGRGGIERGIAPGRDRAAQPLTPVRARCSKLSRDKRQPAVASGGGESRSAGDLIRYSNPRSRSSRPRPQARASNNRWRCSGRP